LLALSLAAGSLLPALLGAQQTAQTEPELTTEFLESRVQEVDASSELDDADKAALLDLYRKSISLIEQRRGYQEATKRFTAARESAPREAARLRDELEKLEAGEAPKLSDSLARKPLPELEQQLLGEKAEMSGLATTLAETETRLDTQLARMQQARGRLNEARKRQLEIIEELQSALTDNQSQRMGEARRWSLQLENRALGAEVGMLEQELLSQPMRTELAGAQRDLATRRMSRQKQFVDLLEKLVVERRRSEAETARQATEETERQAFGKHPLVQQLAQSNTELGEQLKQLTIDLEEITRDENLAASEARRVADNYRLARQKLEIAGLGEALGQALLEQRRGLPDSKDFRVAEQSRQRGVVEASLRQIRHREERTRLRDMDVYVDEILSSLSPTWQTLLRDEIRELAEVRRELINKAIAADDTYLQSLSELDVAQRQLAEAVNAYNEYLAERLLWVRTGDPPSWQMLRTIASRMGIFFEPEHWLELLESLFVPRQFPWILLLGLLLFAVLLRWRGRFRASLERSGRNVGQLRHDRYVATLRALLLTLLLAAPWPILFIALGVHLQLSQESALVGLNIEINHLASWSGQFVPAIGAALYKNALYLFYFIAFRIFCEPCGLAVSHFGWSPQVAVQLRRETRRLMIVFLPSTFILIAAVSYDPAALAGGLSRLFFVIVLLSLGWFFSRIMAPRSGVWRRFYADHPDSPLTWPRYLWVALAVILPTLLAGLTIFGYVYTAAQFGTRLLDTMWLIVAMILVHQLLVRWVLLVERRLVFKDALERRRALRAAREADQEADAGTAENPPLAAEETSIDYVALSANSKKLINTALTVIAALGMSMIWSEVLPAFRILNEISLWSYTVTVDDADQLVPVTLGDAIGALLIVVLAWIAARQLPSLIEIALLTRLDITAGSRYAISKLTQYSIVAISIVLVFGILGGAWSQIQWLVAALGVGIGFGLQEIVANFICGLILLFERPIRIGDVVTVGDTSGVVTKIRIRSTTIRNWDQKELLVPNKEFITGRLLNWTLSDKVARILIRVGIAYGSDVELALRLVREAADEHERVATDPEPLVIFEEFGDSALLIVLRCYIESIDYRLQTQSELNQAIDRKFRDAGIVIAFPQRDLHLDTATPLEVRLSEPLPAADRMPG
jgi:potassium efflux system protein